LQQLGYRPALAKRLTGGRAALVLGVDPAFECRQPGAHARCVQRPIQMLIAVEILGVQHEDPAAGILRLQAGVEQQRRGRGGNAGEAGGIVGHRNRRRTGSGCRDDGAKGSEKSLHDSRL